MDKAVIWERNYNSTQTIEVLQFSSECNGFNVKNLVCGILNGEPILIEYYIVIDEDWKVKEVRLNSLLKGDKSIVLKSIRKVKE